MLFAILADLVLIIHAAFLVFVVLGAILVFWWHKLIWLHVPCFIWGAMIEFRGWICPLTYLENYLRKAAGTGTYTDGFIEHYLMPIVYPPGLTPGIQILLGVAVLVINLVAYGLIWWYR